MTLTLVFDSPDAPPQTLHGGLRERLALALHCARRGRPTRRITPCLEPAALDLADRFMAQCAAGGIEIGLRVE